MQKPPERCPRCQAFDSWEPAKLLDRLDLATLALTCGICFGRWLMPIPVTDPGLEMLESIEALAQRLTPLYDPQEPA